MNFSTNQVRNLYVIKSKDASISETSTVGAGLLKSLIDDMALQYRGAGGLTRSDLIKKGSVYNIVAKEAVDLRTYLRKEKIALDAAYLSGADIDTTKVPVGAELITRINLFQYGSLSQEDQQVKYGSAAITSGMSAATFYKNLANSLKMNSITDAIPLFSINLTCAVGGLTIEVPIDSTYKFTVAAANTTPAAALTSGTIAITPKTSGTVTDINTKLVAAGITDVKVLSIGTLSVVSTAAAIVANGITITELAQPWALGRKEAMPLQYTLTFTSSEIYSVVNGVNRYYQIPWCTSTTKITDTAVLTYTGNGQMIADMEYFCMGERGDDYRMKGFPNIITTEYLVDPTKEYNTLDFDFKYTGTGMENQESIKHMTLVFDNTSGVTLINTFIGDLNTILSTSIATL